jgi:hypothetical protein
MLNSSRKHNSVELLLSERRGIRSYFASIGRGIQKIDENHPTQHTYIGMHRP